MISGTRRSFLPRTCVLWALGLGLIVASGCGPRGKTGSVLAGFALIPIVTAGLWKALRGRRRDKWG
jgi:hypothetical protein